MAQSKAKTVAEYIEELPEERREAIKKVRAVVRKNLPTGYRETMNWGMISYELPLDRYPDTYNGQPLCYAGIASQKNYMSLYLMAAVGDAKQEKFLADEFEKAGKKLDMGKSCLRFKKLDDLPLEAIAEVIASAPPEEMIRRAEKARRAKKK